MSQTRGTLPFPPLPPSVKDALDNAVPMTAEDLTSRDLDEEGVTRLIVHDKGGPEPRAEKASFRVGRRLGQGGFAEVFEAEHDAPGGPVRVALKRLLPALRQDPLRRRHLAREAHLAAQLSHENIVRVLDLVDLGQELAIVMELVDGMAASTLLSRLGQRSLRLTLAAATHIMRGVLGALAYLEAPAAAGHRPLVHADISLENVMVTSRGEVKLLDFGIAGLDPTTPDDEGVTSLHQVAGKRSYFPPESSGATAKAPSVEGDLYATGVCFWELLASFRFPVLPQGTSHREMGSLIAFAAQGLPEGVWNTLRLCLSVDPSLRPGTALEALELLRGLARGDQPFQPHAGGAEALGHLVRCARNSAEEAAFRGHPHFALAGDSYDLVATLVNRLHFAFCAHRVLAYEPVSPEDMEVLGGHEFILRAERGAAGEQVPDYLLRGALEIEGDPVKEELEEPDGTLLYPVRLSGGRSYVVVVQPGEGCVYDPMARSILRGLLRPTAR